MGIAREILLREAHELQLLVAIDGFESFASGEALARFHLDECEDVAAPHDQIDFAAVQAHVSSGDCISAHPVKPDRALFTEAA